MYYYLFIKVKKNTENHAFYLLFISQVTLKKQELQQLTLNNAAIAKQMESSNDKVYFYFTDKYNNYLKNSDHIIIAFNFSGYWKEQKTQENGRS